MARKFSWKGYNVKETQVVVRPSRLALYELGELYSLFAKMSEEEAEESAP